MVYCRSHANVLLGTSDAKLFRITTWAGKVHYVWCDDSEDCDWKFPVSCRAFDEKDDLLQDDISDVKIREEIIPDEDIFCFGGYVYYLRSKPNGNLVIRRICAYSSQKIVEQVIAEDFHDIVSESIYLSNFYVMEANCRKYVMTCWGVVYQDGFLYIPIFDEDRYLIHDRPVSSYIKEEIPVGTVFQCENEEKEMYYQAAADEQGRFYLNYSRSPFLFDRAKSELPKEHTAMIVKMTFNRESSGL